MIPREGMWIISGVCAVGFVVSLITGKTVSPGSLTSLVTRSAQPFSYWFVMFWLAAIAVTTGLGLDWLLHGRHGLS